MYLREALIESSKIFIKSSTSPLILHDLKLTISPSANYI